MMILNENDYNINYIYMFKNPIRFFINVEPFKDLIPNIDKIKFKDLSWTVPFVFNIRKYYGKSDYRNIDFPNLVNFFVLTDLLKKEFKFPNLPSLKDSRMAVNLRTGDFPARHYKSCIEYDMMNLVEYEILLKMDIKSFYDRIYTHDLKKILNIDFNDGFISNQNKGKTAGIIKGPFTSLFLAELFLDKIINDYKKLLEKNGVKSRVEFFSDDIYVFLNKKDEDKAKHSLSQALQKYNMHINSKKHIKYEYLSYSKENIVDKYWNVVVRDQKQYEASTSDNKFYLNFLNQLVYRKDKLDDDRLESIFINGFFKSSYFIDLNPSKYIFTNSDLHKILFIYREHPESILYSIHKFALFNDFNEKVLEPLKKMFLKSLDNPYKEEQVYYFYALKSLYDKKFTDKDMLSKVLKSENQILISYFLNFAYHDDLDGLLSEIEDSWFLNYHVILKKHSCENVDLDELITKYLVPKLKKTKPNNIYMDFYRNAIKNKLYIINKNPGKTIEEYLSIKKTHFEVD